MFYSWKWPSINFLGPEKKKSSFFLGVSPAGYPAPKVCLCCFCSPRTSKPIHLKPGHLKMAFFSARCRLDGAFSVQTAPCLSRWCFPCGISLERAVRIDVSSASSRAKSHFQVRTSERNPIFIPQCRRTTTFGNYLGDEAQAKCRPGSALHSFWHVIAYHVISMKNPIFRCPPLRCPPLSEKSSCP